MSGFSVGPPRIRIFEAPPVEPRSTQAAAVVDGVAQPILQGVRPPTISIIQADIPSPKRSDDSHPATLSAKSAEAVTQDIQAGYTLRDALDDPELFSDKSEVSDSLTPKVHELLDAVKSGQKKPFQEQVKSLYGEDHKVCALVIRETLKSLSLDDKQEHKFIIDNLREVFPGLVEYFKRVEPDPDRQLPEAYAISTKGIQLMVDNLKTRNKLAIDCKVCDSPHQLADHLAVMQSSKRDSRCAFIVRHPGLRGQGVHVTPILAEMKGGKLHLVITDSANFGYGMNIVHALRDKVDTNNLEVHLYIKPRQSDHSNCPIFALRDVVQFGRYPDFLEYVQSCPPGVPNEQEKEPFQKIMREAPAYTRVFDRLPAVMLKTTQSVTRIQERDASALPLIEKHTREGVIKGERKPINTLVEERFLKYERLVLASVIAGAIVR